MAAAVAGLAGVDSAEGVLEETVAARYGDRQTITRVRGLEGAWQCSVSSALAQELGIKTYFTDQLALFFPASLRVSPWPIQPHRWRRSR